MAAQPVDGAWVRLRWSVAEEERHQVDRAALQTLLAGAAGVQFEGRIVPVLRVRAGGIGQAGALRDKVAAWAAVVDARPEPLWICLDELMTREAQRIVDDALAAPQGANGRQEAVQADAAPYRLDEQAPVTHRTPVSVGAEA